MPHQKLPRLDPRARVCLRVDVTPRWAGAHAVRAGTLDLSVSGAICRSPEYLPLKMQVHVELHLPATARQAARRVSCEAVVVGEEQRGEKDWRVALYFLGLGGEDHEAVRRFVFEILEAGRQGQTASMGT